MSDLHEDEIEASEEQLTLLRELGASESELEGLAFDEAEALIAELRSMREGAGRA